MSQDQCSGSPDVNPWAAAGSDSHPQPVAPCSSTSESFDVANDKVTQFLPKPHFPGPTTLVTFTKCRKLIEEKHQQLPDTLDNLSQGKEQGQATSCWIPVNCWELPGHILAPAASSPPFPTPCYPQYWLIVIKPGPQSGISHLVLLPRYW